MSLFDKLPSEDKELIAQYIADHTRQEYEDVYKNLRYLLRYWDEAKSEYLYKLLGEQFMIKVPFEETYDEQTTVELLESQGVVAAINDILGYVPKKMDYYPVGMAYQASLEFITELDLVRNVYSGESFEIKIPNSNRTIKVVKNQTKMMKLLQKLVTTFAPDKQKEFEEIRLRLSQLPTLREVKGELVLSIHPMDFLTMSDNGYNWRTCMTWGKSMDKLTKEEQEKDKDRFQPGSYRQGTIEMMNSKCVVVCYIDDRRTPYYPVEGKEWSNKRWRELFIVDPAIIVNAVGYPYCERGVEEKVVDWLAELGEENLEWDFSNHILLESYDNYSLGNLHFEFETSKMYNDFDKDEDHFSAISSQSLHPGTIQINYSGYAECMCCGKTDQEDVTFHDEDQIMCDDCNDEIECFCCGKIIPLRDAEWIDGTYYCSDCRRDNAVTCAFCSKLVPKYAATGVYCHEISPANVNYFCVDCLSSFNKNCMKGFARVPIDGIHGVHAKSLTEEAKDFFDKEKYYPAKLPI